LIYTPLGGPKTSNKNTLAPVIRNSARENP